MPSRVATQQQALARMLTRLDAPALRALGRDVARTALDRALTYDGDDGRTGVIPLLLAPALLSHADARYLHATCLQFLGAVRKIAAARIHDPEIRAVLPLSPSEEEWLALASSQSAPLMGRFDMNVDPSRGARVGDLLEFNGCAVGGINYGPGTSETVLERVAPLHRGFKRGSKLQAPDSMREAWLELCVDHARAQGRNAAALHIVWLEDRDWEAGITEGPTMVEYARRAGHHAAVADPRDLELRAGEIVRDGRPVDIVYRGIELRDILAIEAEHGPLTAMREAVRRERVLSPLQGDLDHKSLLEMWSSRRFAHLFTAAERAAFRRHVLWTRLVSARRTDGPAGRDIDLPEYVRRHRTTLVLKPNRACGGEGILVGRTTTAAKWERTIARSVSGREPAVVQTYIRGATIESPVVRGKRIHHERHFTNFGLFASPRRLGFLGRAAPFPVVNVSRGGGLMAVLLV